MLTNELFPGLYRSRLRSLAWFYPFVHMQPVGEAWFSFCIHLQDIRSPDRRQGYIHCVVFLK